MSQVHHEEDMAHTCKKIVVHALFLSNHGCAVDKADACFTGDLGLILDKTIKLEWHRTNNMRTRCMRITQKVGRTLTLIIISM